MRFVGNVLAFTLLLSLGVYATSTNSEFTRNENIPTRSSCGYQEFNQTDDGEETGLSENPWVVLLQYNLPSGKIRFFCSGSLISPRYVLTAAHCVTGDPARIGTLTSVRFGEYNTVTEIDCKSPENCNQSPVDIEVEEIIPHKGFIVGNRNRNNDLALIRLKKVVPYSKYIKPICLPEPNESASTGDIVTLAKWERDGSGTMKKKVTLPVVAKEKCQEKYLNLVELIDSQFCAGGQLGKDACRGDGGGPLQKTTKSNSSQQYQEGIVSFGPSPCGKKDFPSVYTKVAYYLPWIHTTVRD